MTIYASFTAATTATTKSTQLYRIEIFFRAKYLGFNDLCEQIKC